MRNEVLLKTFWYGLCENASVSMATPYMILENGGMHMQHGENRPMS